MPKLELQRGHRIFLGLAGAVLVASVTGIWQTWGDTQELEQQQVTLQGNIAVARAKIAQIEGLEREVIILRENLKEYVRILPDSVAVAEFYADLNQYTAEAGVQLTNLTPAKLGEGSSFNRAEYKLSFKSDFHQLLHFVNLIENHRRFVSISSLRIKAGRESSDLPGPMLHDVNLTTETYVYAGSAVGSGVTIPGYDRKKIQLTEQIQESRHDLDLEHFQLLVDSNRRDPLVDPRIRLIDGVALASEDLEAQRALILEVEGLLEECSAIFDLMDGAESMIREMELRHEGVGLLAQIGDKVQQIQSRGEIFDASLRRSFEADVLGDLMGLQQRIGRIDEHERPDENLMRIRGGLERMAEAFEMGDYQQVVDIFELMEAVRARLFSHPDAVEMGSRMDDFYLVSSTALEFSEQEIAVSGLIEFPDREEGSEVESVAIINGSVYREGEAVDDDLYLLEIHQDYLRFEFKGVPLNFDF